MADHLPPSEVAARLRTLADWIDLHRPEGITSAHVTGYAAGRPMTAQICAAELARLAEEAGVQPAISQHAGALHMEASVGGVHVVAVVRP